ncbi:MAG: YhdP family phospholipid transporter, partial [Methylococcaceae bacterium]
MIHHITRATRHLIFWSLIATALGLTGVRLLLSGIDHYKSALSTQIGERVGAPVKIGRLSAKMRGFSPELILKDINISAVVPSEKPAIQIKEIRLGVNLFDMLLSRELLASSWVTLVGVKLSVIRKPDGSFAIAGLKATDGEPLWLLQGGKYEVLQSEIIWQDEKYPRRPLKFAAVDMAIINNADRHRINLLTKLPDKYGHGLRASMDFKGNFFEPSTIDGELFIEGDHLQLPEWITADLPLNIKLDSGLGNLKVWSKLKHSELVSINVEAQVQQLKLARHNDAEFPANGLKTRFRWERNEEQWRLDVSQLILETSANQNIGKSMPHKKWPNAVFSVSGNKVADNALPDIGLFIEQLNLQEASRVTQFFGFLPEPQTKLLAQADLKGSLEKFSLFVEPNKKAMAVNGNFANVSIAPFLNVPGMAKLSGQITGTEKSGSLHFVMADTQLDWPDFFPEAIPVDKLKGRLNWRETDDQWLLSSQKIELDLPGFQSKNRFQLIIPKTGELPFIDLQSSFISDDVGKMKQYLPTKVMSQDDVDWYGRAFPGGRVTKGGLLYVSKLGKFPAKAKDGVFEIVLALEQLQLAYALDWPLITDISGTVLVENSTLNCEVYQGLSNNLKIGHATVINPDMRTSKTLMIKGGLTGTIADAFDFLMQTPLKSRVELFVNALTPQGDTDVTLDLDLPLVGGMTPKVAVVAQLNHAELKVNAVDLLVSQIDGDLKFTESGVDSDTINAKALGQPVKIKINGSEHQQTMVNVEGRAEIKALQSQFKMPGWEMAKGAMNYQLKLGLPEPSNRDATHSSSELAVHSNLVGVELLLPGFLAKTASQERPLSLMFVLGDNASLPIVINYDDTLKAAIKVAFPEQSLHSGHVLIGQGEAVQPSEAGLLLEINQEQLNLQDWIGLSINQNNNGGSGLVNAIRQIKLHGKQAQWKNTQLGRFDLVLKPDNDDWFGAIDSAFATGQLRIPADLNGAEKIILDMTSLDFSALKQLTPQNKGQSADARMKAEQLLSPAGMPLLKVTSLKTLWQSVDLGQLKLETERLPDGMMFKQIELTSAQQQLSMSGDWKINAQHP